MRKPKKKSKPLPVMPWSLPGHSWYPKAWGAKPDSVVREFGDWQLVRNVRAKTHSAPVSKRFDDMDTTSAGIEALNLLDMLAQRASKGDATAGKWLARVTSQAALSMRDIARTNPKAFKQTARSRYGWPVIKKAREALSDDERDYFAAIELGKDAVIELNPQAAKWKPDAAGKIAHSLLLRIEQERTERGFDFGLGSSASKKLPEFDDSTSSQWWEAAKGILLASYPMPETVTELNQLVTSASKRKSAGRLRQAIFDLLRDRMTAMARPEPAYRT